MLSIPELSCPQWTKACWFLVEKLFYTNAFCRTSIKEYVRIV